MAAAHLACRQVRCFSISRRAVYVVAMARPWRPEMDDVDRLSRGEGVKRKRGTGSFHIPHRLNSDERPVFETAKKKGYLQVRGTGYRKGRKGHPLPNIYRQVRNSKVVLSVDGWPAVHLPYCRPAVHCPQANQPQLLSAKPQVQQCAPAAGPRACFAPSQPPCSDIGGKQASVRCSGCIDVCALTLCAYAAHHHLLTLSCLDLSCACAAQ
jgi:hypothetical protein